MLAWPHADTDWAPWLEQVEQVYTQVIDAVNQAGAGVILLCQSADAAAIQAHLGNERQVMLVTGQYNDTWMRDYGFLTVAGEHGPQPVEFLFNGWGQKFNAIKDNLVNQTILAGLCAQPLLSFDRVVEGGALEIDDNGHLLSTAQCLLNPKRNQTMTLDEYKSLFSEALGARQTTIFTQGHLIGDDTDGHIDTLVRFTPQQGVVIQACDNRPQDPHFAGLQALCEQVAEALPEHTQYRLPLPHMVNAENERLPASYANFLICNESVLVPVYGQPEDEAALAVMAQAFTGHKIVPVDCAALIQQFGSLHCISMQVPQGTLTDAVRAQLQQGVTLYGNP